MNTPLEQFIIRPVVRIYTSNNWIDLTISNSTIFMLISTIIIVGLIRLTNNRKIVISKWRRLIEELYVRMEETIREIITIKYIKYYPFLFSLFLFVLLNNTIGLIPYSFTTTSGIIITITMSLSIMIGVTLIGFKKHSFKFFTLFIPSMPSSGGFIKFILPLIFLIELISYLSRIISLAVRLTANMFSGHTLLKIIANYGLQFTFFFPYLLLTIPLILLIAIFILEIGVSIIQAYVFTVLTASYIKDVEELH